MSQELDAILALSANFEQATVVLSPTSTAVLFYALEDKKVAQTWKVDDLDEITPTDEDSIDEIVDLAFRELMLTGDIQMGCCAAGGKKIRLDPRGKVQSYLDGDYVDDLSADDREWIPLRRSQDPEAPNMTREATGVAVSVLGAIVADIGIKVSTLDSGQVIAGTMNDDLADFTVKAVAYLGVSPNPLAYICAAQVVEFYTTNLALFAGVFASGLTQTNAACCAIFPFVSNVDNSITYDDWLTIKDNILINVGNTYNNIGLLFERILVLIGRKGLTNALSMNIGVGGFVGDGTGDGTFGNTTFDNTACP